MKTPNARMLEVLICGKPAGTLSQLESGELRFSYHDSYSGVPLSLSMPVSNAVYGDKKVRPYLFGLLPDDRNLRRSIGMEMGISGNNPFALLAAKGLDCPGAVQFCPADLVEFASNRERVYREISLDRIGERLRKISNRPTSTWQAPSEHWSLGGQQGKIALARFNGQWYECQEAAATTHILKPGIPHLLHQALNEHFCLELASACGIPAARSSFCSFAGMPAIVVERYDRFVSEPFQVIRYHQEDLCQALGVLPDRKYASDGGPSARDIVTLLARYPRSEENRTMFAAQLFFNYLIGAPDAHGKNYSVLLDPMGRPWMAPLYDVASGLVYEQEQGEWLAAMSIGGENRFGHVQRSNIERFANIAGLDPTTMIDLMGNLAEAIVREMPNIAARIQSYEGAPELSKRLMSAIEGLCKRTIDML